MTEDEHIDAVASGQSVGDVSTSFVVESVNGDGQTYELIGDERTLRRTYAITQLMSASLYAEDAQLDSFTKTMIRDHMSRSELTLIGEPRIAYHFGRYVHEHGDGVDSYSTPCTDACHIANSDEADADVVLMRIELDVEGNAPTPVEEIEGDDE